MRREALVTTFATVPIAGSGCVVILDSPEARFGYFDRINYDRKLREFHVHRGRMP
ncbi:hypothetical protein [Haladaptatus sp. DFWS20]|uniref:hypothetical protein n=1 Tax=Haladaptatus sp. DFWS20 TaxID=3403467 RepID=UPI003EBD8F4B